MTLRVMSPADGTQHNGNQHNGNQHNATQHNDHSVCSLSFMYVFGFFVFGKTYSKGIQIRYVSSELHEQNRQKVCDVTALPPFKTFLFNFIFEINYNKQFFRIYSSSI